MSRSNRPWMRDRREEKTVMADGINYFFLDYLKKNFGEDFPIFLEEIKFNEYSRAQIIDMLDDLCKCEKLSKFDEDVYYIPTDTFLGKSVLSAKQVNEYYRIHGKKIYQK